jgi:FkbH-like protein
MLNDFLRELFTGQFSKALALLESVAKETPSPETLAMLRLAILRPGHTFLTYQRLLNIWTSWGKPALKPNAVLKKVAIVADFTADHFAPMISLFASAQGVQIETHLPGYDSIEQTILDPNSPLYASQPDIVIIFFSERWLKRYAGNSALCKTEDLQRGQESLSGLIQALETHSHADILIGNLPLSAWPLAGGIITKDGLAGWNQTVSRWNEWLTTLTSRNLRIVDLAVAIFNAGGSAVLGRTNYLRARMAYEMPGTLAVARELAGGLAHISGRTHRAFVSDWDNTLWGGEVAELGSHGVLCGQDSPDALGYFLIQEYIKSLTCLGVLLAGVSRNDPEVQKIFDENHDLPLNLGDFSSLQVGWTPKSDAVGRISKELGFGPEFMVFMDDSLYEIAQVLSVHPYIDVLWAGPDPQGTLDRIAHSRFFNALSLSEEDLQRGSHAALLKEQREFKSSFTNIEEFLQAIQVKLTFAPVDENNMERVIQLFQKTNQFNLTTRRHREDDLKNFSTQGGSVFAISYEDSFGSQGIISVIALQANANALNIESWLMSCRVLNRSVEQAVFSFILEKAEGKPVTGEYIPTEKNGLVRTLFPDLGFTLESTDPETSKQIWKWTNNNQEPPKHFVEIKKL